MHYYKLLYIGAYKLPESIITMNSLLKKKKEDWIINGNL